MKFALGLWIIGVVYAVLYIVPPAEGLGDLVKIAFFSHTSSLGSSACFYAGSNLVCTIFANTRYTL